MKQVYKYGTGQEIPKGAVYLSTQVETATDTRMEGNTSRALQTNIRVWHYFLVEVEK